MVDKKVQRIKFIVAIIVVIIAALYVIIRVQIYNKNGEKNMPFTVSEIIVVSTARKYEPQDEEPVQNNEAIWNFNVVQNNDMYIAITNNSEKNEKIKSVTIANIEIKNQPKKGMLEAYMPNSMSGERYTYDYDFKVSQSLTYNSAEDNSYKNLKINKNGGNISISFANKALEKYSSGNEYEVTYDGRMLAKMGITDEDLKSKVAFDIIIELEDQKKYSGRIEVDINCEGLVENGISQIDIKDFSNVVFKRL